MRWIRYVGLLCLTGCSLEPNDTFSVTGSVVSEASAEAVPGAMVELMYHAPFTSWGELSVLGSATTGTGGSFQIVVDDEFTYNCGNLLLRASAPGYVPVEFHGVAGNDSEDGAGDVADRCADGETAASPIRLLEADR